MKHRKGYCRVYSPIAKDGKRACRSWEVDAHEAADTRALNLKDVVICSYAEIISAKRKCHIGERVSLIALDGVLAVESLLGAHLFVQQLGEGGGQSDQRSAGIENDTGVVKIGCVFAKGDRVQVDFPVRLASERDLGQLARIVGAVDTAEGRLGLGTVVGVAEIEGEDGLIDQILINHVVKRGRDMIDRDGIVTETQDAIETAKGKGQTRLAGCFSEQLVLDLKISNAESVL